MRLSTALCTLVVAALASGIPVRRNSDHQINEAETGKAFTDLDILQYVLSLENIEFAFYQQGINNFTTEDFANAGYTPDIRRRYAQIFINERTHVERLTSTIMAAGIQPVQACTYAFPITTIEEFISTTRTFENFGGSAWNGASSLIEDPAIASLAGGILSVEARQAAWIGATVFHQNPWNTPFEAPLNFRQVYTVAKGFVTSCPEGEPLILGYNNTFPPLEVIIEGSYAKFHFEKPVDDKPLYAVFIQGNSTDYAPINNATGQATLPDGLRGYVYALVTNEIGKISDNLTVAGPTILQFPYDSRGTLIAED